jgi:hypothetical protein
VQLKTNSGRNRLNILGAYSPDERDLISLEFRKAVQNVLNNIAAYRDELSSLMTERFQLFTTP